MGSLSIWHWVIVLVLIVLLFGRGRISALMADMGGGIRAFRRELRQSAKSSRPSNLSAKKDISKAE
ncbi:twin-arginine translocase TatA/TatE family subunit [Rhizobium leguminosarum]|uniref:twin-arginine translocase TatA/TatE family subunit n=1 Tax=Rhizobium leguminosarum TaxID=384 RepID=UPI001C94C264|nr:twin-arginine translocase TatA/TatE family subunit [Rhizobium leguminosarum]MBY5482083.1 twin-arginine translocase TatA/TatE family subunit [Rhizobium leguminosarum]